MFFLPPPLPQGHATLQMQNFRSILSFLWPSTFAKQRWGLEKERDVSMDLMDISTHIYHGLFDNRNRSQEFAVDFIMNLLITSLLSLET